MLFILATLATGDTDRKVMLCVSSTVERDDAMRFAQSVSVEGSKPRTLAVASSAARRHASGNCDASRCLWCSADATLHVDHDKIHAAIGHGDFVPRRVARHA